MALSTATFTKSVSLVEYGKGLPADSLERVFVETMARTSDLLAAMRIMPATNGKFNYEQIGALPSVQMRGLNEPGNNSSGAFTLGEEGVYFMDEYIQVDRALVDNFGPQRRAKQENLKMIAMSQAISRLIVGGNNTTNPREFNGLKNRALTLNKTLFYNSVASGGAALSLAQLDIMNRAVNGMTHWIFPYNLLAYMDAAARNPALTNRAVVYDTDPDYGRKIMKLYDKPVLFGYEPDDSPLLLDFTEVGQGGGGAVTASIYGVALNDDRVMMLEGSPLSVEDEGMIQGQPQYSTHLKWDIGLVHVHPRALARLTSITQATIVA